MSEDRKIEMYITRDGDRVRFVAYEHGARRPLEMTVADIKTGYSEMPLFEGTDLVRLCVGPGTKEYRDKLKALEAAT